MNYDQFVTLAEHFLIMSDCINDGWEAKDCEKVIGSMYLIKRLTVSTKQSVNINDITCEHIEEFEEDINTVYEDHSTSISSSACYSLSCEYHIVYSSSYSSPVLYFNVWNPDGNLLSLEEIWLYLIDNHHKRLKNETWNFLTQQEHPLLRRPFFQLHPCFTPHLLGCVSKTSRNPLVTWLSSVGPIVGLNLSSEYVAVT